MSFLSDTLRDANEVHFLVDLDFKGTQKRFSDVQADVPAERVTNLIQYSEINNSWYFYSSGTSYQYINYDGYSKWYLTRGSGSSANLSLSTELAVPRASGRSAQVDILDIGDDYYSVIFQMFNADNELYDIQKGETYTVSFYVWCDKNVTFSIAIGGNNVSSTPGKVEVTAAAKRWKKVEAQFTFTSVETYTYGNNPHIEINLSETTFVGTFRFDRFMFEKKEAASDVWIPTLGGKRSGFSYNNYSFEDKIMSIGEVGSSFDIRNFRYSSQSLSVTIKNPFDGEKEDRLQDLEATTTLDGCYGNVYIWCPGLAWEDIQENALIHRGIFQKTQHDSQTYTFELIDRSESGFLMVPNKFINDTTFAFHRKDGSNSVSGNEQQLVFGDWPKGVPLDCVLQTQTGTTDRYLLSCGRVLSPSNAYRAATEYIWNKNGTTYAFAASGVSIHDALDGQGNPYSYITFSTSQSASEPLSCSVQGISDSGVTLIEHPADIVKYLFENYTTLANTELDTGSFVKMKNVLPGLKYTTLINSNIDCATLIDRLLSKTICSRINRFSGKIGLVAVDFKDNIRTKYTKDLHNMSNRIVLSKTPYNMVCNDLTVKYGLNAATKKYEKVLYRNRNNNLICKLSELEYGKQPEIVLTLSDVWDDSTAAMIASRYLTFYSHRHDLVKWEVSYADGIDILEGQMVQLTLPEGSSLDGLGYLDERFILLQRTFKKSTIEQLLWRVRVNMDYQVLSTIAGSGEVTFGGEIAILGGEDLTW